MMINPAKTKKNIVNFWVKNQPKTLFLLIIMAVMNLLRQLPYFNITLTFSIIGIFLWIVSLLLFKLKSGASVIVVVFALLATGLAVAIQETESVQEVANFAYYMDIFVFFQVLLERRDEKRAVI